MPDSVERERYRFEPAFAIYRVYRDRLRTPVDEEDFEAFCLGTVQAIRVLWSRDEALAEAQRLNRENADKGAYYYCLYTRVERRECE